MMKRLLTLILVAIAFQSCSLAHLIPSHASPSVDVTINIDLQPAWGPIGYDYAAYYYMPEINIYYDVNHSRFYYPSGSRWISAEYLPPSYRVYDLFKVYKVVFNYDEPWSYNRTHRAQYKHYRDDRSQIPIRMSNDKRYEKSWDNLRPWVDPDRRSNRENDYHLRTQNQQAGSSKYIEDHRNNGYRVEGDEHNKQMPSAGSSYRNQQPPQKPATMPKPSTEKADRQPNKTDKSYNAPSSSSSYRQQSNTPSQPASDGVSSRGKARKQTTTEPKTKSPSKPTSTKSNESANTRSSKNSTDKSASSPSPSASYRSGNSSSVTGSTTSTRGR